MAALHTAKSADPPDPPGTAHRGPWQHDRGAARPGRRARSTAGKRRGLVGVTASAASIGLLAAALLARADTAGSFCEGAGASCRPDAPVVDVAWLRAALAADEDVQVIDVRPPEAFAAGHVPGSLSLDVAALRATRDGVAGQVAPADRVEATLRAAGLRAGARAVVVAHEVGLRPARVVWTLHYFGHPDAHLLQGGWAAWTAARAEAESGPTTAPPGDFVASAPVDGLRVDAAWILEHLEDPRVTLIDARSTAEYEAGHIPGALHVDWRENVRGGSLRARAELAALYAGVPREGTAVAYCKSGMRSALTYVVLRALGYPDVRVYDGSWNEWGAREELPRETSAAAGDG